jgi:hypothetical protein
MGDQLRFTPDGPRQLEDSDYRPDGMPKVVINSEEKRVSTVARFEPILEPERHRRLLAKLDERGRSQRGKPRARDGSSNPLGGRLFDMDCGWPMYRVPDRDSFGYLCGLYQQSRPRKCRHNRVEGPAATRFLLESIRQRVFTPSKRSRLEEKLRVRAASERAGRHEVDATASRQATLDELKRKRDKVATNMALAENEAQYRSMAEVFERLERERESLESEILSSSEDARTVSSPEEEVEAALAQLDRMEDLASDPQNMEAIGELFQSLNACMYLQFVEASWGKRRVNRIVGGVVAFGATPPPVTLYEGPTGRRQLMRSTTSLEAKTGAVCSALDPCNFGGEGGSLGNVSRGERI